MDLRDQLDHAIGVMGRLSALAYIADLRKDLHEFNRPKCGDCFLWMKSRLCPKEHNVNGYTRGPNCNGAPCDKYQEVAYMADLRKEKEAEIDKRLKALGL